MARQTQQFNPRQTMSRPDFEIYHYHDPKMTEVPLHHHDFYEIYYFLSGKVEYLVEGMQYTLLPGDLLLISPMELHRPQVAPDESYERIVLWIHADYLEQVSPDGEKLTRCFQSGKNLFHCTHTAIPGLIERLAAEFHSRQPGSALCARGLFLQLMAELCRLTAIGGSAQESPQLPPLIAQVIREIGTHYREELSLETLAARFYVSKYYLAHQFRQSVGTSVYHYILLKRLQHAHRMIAEGSGPGEACQSCGFQDYTSFYRAFRQVYGISPLQAQ